MTDKQIEDLRERMRLLQQDRRANLDLLESSKASNAEKAYQLREENKELRLRLTKLQKRGGSSQSDLQVLTSVQKELLAMRYEYDNLKVQSSKYKTQLQNLNDELKICELEARRPNLDTNPLTRQIQTLENRLDKAMAKYNEAQSIRRTYEHIVKRLKEERISYDNQLQALESTFQSKGRDYDELLLLSADANRARDAAHQELQKERQIYEENKSKRDTELRERQQLVKVRKHMVERQNKREAKRREIIEKQLRQDEMTTSNSTKDLNKTLDLATLEANERKIDVYEAAFRKIKAATGVSDVNEVIKKVSGQEATSENLMSLTNNNQGRLDILNDEKERLRKETEEAKYNNSGNSKKRKEIEKYEEQLSESTKKVEQLKTRFERLNNIFVNVKAGVKHLQNKLDPSRKHLKLCAINLSDSTIVSILRSFQDILKEVLSQIKDRADENFLMNVGLDANQESNDNSGQIDALNIDEIQSERAYNQRVKFPMLGEDEDGLKAFDPLNDDGMVFEIEDDECDLSRDRIKRFSSQILISETKKASRNKKAVNK